MEKTIIYNGKNHKVFTLNTEFGNYEVICTEDRYDAFDNLAVEVLTVKNGEVTGSFAMLTVNVVPMGDAYTCVDTNNDPWAVDFIRENNLAKPIGSNATSGYCSYPIYEFDTSKFYA